MVSSYLIPLYILIEKQPPVSAAPSPPSAGSLPGEALAPGVPGGAAKLSDIAKARIGGCWSVWTPRKLGI